ncbi:MAG: redoxin domain-containing protein [Myxococcota bacterium]
MAEPAGQPAPDFTATDHRGQSISLAEVYRESSVALIFYRGDW